MEASVDLSSGSCRIALAPSSQFALVRDRDHGRRILGGTGHGLWQRFTGEICDYNFTHAGGTEGLEEINDRLEAEAKKAVATAAT